MDIIDVLKEFEFPIFCVIVLAKSLKTMYQDYHESSESREKSLMAYLQESGNLNKSLTETNRQLTETNRELSQTNIELTETNRTLIEEFTRDVRALSTNIKKIRQILVVDKDREEG